MLFSISWQFDSIRFDFKKVEIELGFESISKVEIDKSNRFLKLEPKSDPTINLYKIYIYFSKLLDLRLK